MCNSTSGRWCGLNVLTHFLPSDRFPEHVQQAAVVSWSRLIDRNDPLNSSSSALLFFASRAGRVLVACITDCPFARCVPGLRCSALSSLVGSEHLELS